MAIPSSLSIPHFLFPHLQAKGDKDNDRISVLFGALALGPISLPMEASALCIISFLGFIWQGPPFLTSWSSDCMVCDWTSSIFPCPLSSLAGKTNPLLSRFPYAQSPYTFRVIRSSDNYTLATWAGTDLSHYLYVVVIIQVKTA